MDNQPIQQMDQGNQMMQGNQMIQGNQMMQRNNEHYQDNNMNMGNLDPRIKNMGQGLGARGHEQEDILNAIIKTNVNNELHQIRSEIQNHHVILSKQLEDIKVSTYKIIDTHKVLE